MRYQELMLVSSFPAEPFVLGSLLEAGTPVLLDNIFCNL